MHRRTLCCCAAVCRFWQEVANEDALWHQVTLTEYYRPNLLAYAAAWLPAGWSTQAAVRAAVSLGVAAARDCLHAQEPRTAGTSNDDQAFAATNRIETQQEQQHEGSQEHSRQQPALGMGQDVSKGSSGLSASSSPKAGLKDLCLAGMVSASSNWTFQLSLTSSESVFGSCQLSCSRCTRAHPLHPGSNTSKVRCW